MTIFIASSDSFDEPASEFRPRRKALRPDLDNLASIARAADEEIVREREAEAAARQQRVDAALLDDPFGKLPIRGNGGVDHTIVAASRGNNRQPACDGAA